ncbi:MAG: Crp/Fnr family transcriptional regulator [Chloroflexi bacterium]|nr:Crp/Fnr family transcriptional regulator [Chloroflexota bacterium]
MVVHVDFLKSQPYFAGLGPAELAALAGLFFEKAVPKGEIISLAGEPGEALYFVVSGVVKVFQTSADGKEQVLRIVHAGESFNDVPVFDDGPNPVSAQSMTPVVLYGIRRADLKSVLHSYPQFAANVIKVLARRVRELMVLVEDLSFRHVIGRVAKILLEHAGEGTGPGSWLTQQEMAAIAGTTREVVGRSLKHLQEEGAIKMDHHRIVIVNREALQNIVEAAN